MEYTDVFREKEEEAMSLRESKVSLRKARASNTGNTSAGTFNGLDLVYIEEPLYSTVHCVGESYEDDAWIRRSCEFRNFCFDVQQQDFVLFRSPRETALHEAIHDTGHESFLDVSTSIMNNMSVSIGGVNPKWTMREHGVPRLEWFPKIVDHELKGGYYELPSDIVWIPFHSLAGFNPGHLVWDDFLAAYTLLSMFQLLENKQHLLMRYTMDPGLWASCDVTDDKRLACKAMFAKFLPLMGIDPDTFSTNQDFSLVAKTRIPQSNYVCSRHGLAGLGLLTDHGTKLHGWDRKDYKTTHNHGRGAMLYNFRNFLVENMGIKAKPVDAPYKITFSLNSSSRKTRNLPMNKQMNAVKKAFKGIAEVQSYTMSDLSIQEQVRIAAESAIYITACGGGAVTATFLPKGSSLIIYFDEVGGTERNRRAKLPARLDWDMFNNAVYMRTHWLPMRTMNGANDIRALVELIRHELEIKLNEE